MLNRENITYGSVCSGIEAATMAWHGLGWEAAWFAEIEAFPSAVLAHHYPSVPNLGDMTKIRDMVASGEVSAPDILVGGTPCQAFSVAGARQSLDDERGQLTLEYVRLANEIDAVRHANGQQPCVIVWENVPGVLNTKDNAFGCFLGALSGAECELQPSGKKWTNAGCVYGPQRTVAWRILDAQYFGVAQRRRRVFVVASAREGFNPAEVLFEFEGVRRDSPPSRSSGQDVAANVAPGFTASSFGGFRAGVGTLRAHGGSETLTLQPFRKLTFESYAADETASTIMARDYKCATDLVCVHGTQDPITQTDQAFPLGRNNGQENAVFGIPGNRIGRKPENGGNATEPMDNISPCQTKTDRHAVADICVPLNSMTMMGRPSDDLKPRMGLGVGSPNDPQNTLSCNHHHAAFFNGRVRRLTPKEAERLQGFPDFFTQIPYRNKSAADCPDGPRYAALGNSMAVPVMAWIGSRIEDAINAKT